MKMQEEVRPNVIFLTGYLNSSLHLFGNSGFIVYVSAISFAEHSIHMTNSYFIPDDQIVKALTDAAARC